MKKSCYNGQEKRWRFLTMKYRPFGKTGEMISALGFGCMRLPTAERDGRETVNEELAIPLLRRAVELGVNYFDTAWGYLNGESQYVVGRALKPFRDRVLISTKLPMPEVTCTADFDRFLDGALERLDTDRIDFYHFHGINYACFEEKILGYGLLDRAERALSDGRIRHLSFSFHDDPRRMKDIADAAPFSSVLCQYNLIDRKNEESMAYCAEKGMGIVVMGPLGGGNITLGGPDFLKKFSVPAESAAELGLKFVWGNPSVSCALSGMRSLEELEENVRLAEAADAVRASDWNALCGESAELAKLAALYCTGCRYCDVCPQGIRPFAAMSEYNRMHVWGLTEGAKQRYGRAKARGELNITDCIACGACSERCPQKLDIPGELDRIDRIFSELN